MGEVNGLDDERTTLEEEISADAAWRSEGAAVLASELRSYGDRMGRTTPPKFGNDARTAYIGGYGDAIADLEHLGTGSGPLYTTSTLRTDAIEEALRRLPSGSVSMAENLLATALAQDRGHADAHPDMGPATLLNGLQEETHG
jgi:hypothetical protein